MPADFDARAAAGAIAAIQLPDGAIPHVPGGPVDPWNHVEAAMALDAGGLHAEALAAYRWLARTQRPDGTWPASVRGDQVEDPTSDANLCAYVATGLRHHLLAAHDLAAVAGMWPVVERAIGFVLELQGEAGEVRWARDPEGRVWHAALLTGCSSIHHSLRCAAELGAALGHERPGWDAARARLGAAIRERPDLFEDKSRFAMDWYYPVLGGAVTGDAARERLRAGWDRFVVEGWGCLCVADRPWVTAAETAELVIACDAAGLDAEANALFEWVQALRAPSGGFWTGWNHPDREVWPEEQPAWTTGAVVLAAAVLDGAGAAASMFRHEAGEELIEPVA